MAPKAAATYRPLTPPLSWPERIADALVMGVLIFWFAFLGVTPQKGRPVDLPKRPLDDDHRDPLSGIAAE